MTRKPTISDVARVAGVSKGAVSFALNGRGGVSSETRERIMAAADELGWTPSHQARSLSTSRALAVGLVLSRDPRLLGADPFFPAFIAGVEAVLATAGYALLLQVVTDEAAEQQAYRALAANGRVDGVFVTDLRLDDVRLQTLAELTVAAVTLGRPAVESPFPAVSEDDHAGVGELVQLLLGQGHTRIAHVSGPMEFLHSRRRRQAWAAALAGAGLAEGPLVVSDYTAAGGRAATEQLLELTERPTAVVYGNDLMAIAGIGVAQQRGLRVPQDLSVVGYGGSEISAFVNPPLTTVTSDPFGWGESAAGVLLDLINGRDHPADTALPPLELVVRASTAPLSDTTESTPNKESS